MQYSYDDPVFGPVIPVLQYSAVAVVFPAFEGVITCGVIDTNQPGYQLEVTAAETAWQDITELEQSGVAPVTAGLGIVGGSAFLLNVEIFPALQLGINWAVNVTTLIQTAMTSTRIQLNLDAAEAFAPF